MAQFQVARLGDLSSHGGSIISASSTVFADGIPVARVGDLHACPIPGHGTTAISAGSGRFVCEGDVIAVVNSTVGCGAIITTGSPKFYAPYDGGGGGDNSFRLDISILDGPNVLG